MNCHEIETRLMDYLEGGLPAREREAIELHARACAACAERIRGFSGVFAALDSWEDIQPSPAFNVRLQERIEAEPSFSGWFGSLFDRLMPVRVRIPVFALALLLVISVGAMVVRYSTSPVSTAAIQQPATLSAAAGSVDDLVLYRGMPVLEDVDILGNYDVLREIDPNH